MMDNDEVGEENLTKEEIKEYRELFSYFDLDGGGIINSLELGRVMKSFVWNPTEAGLQVSIQTKYILC